MQRGARLARAAWNRGRFGVMGASLLYGPPALAAEPEPQLASEADPVQPIEPERAAEPGSPRPRSADAEPPKPSGGVVTPPRPLRTDAVYPAGATGSAEVLLELVIERDGSVASAHVVEGEEPFAGAAAKAALSWRFSPAERDSLYRVLKVHDRQPVTA